MSNMYQEIEKARREHKEFALCIVTGTHGSTPRDTGAKMMVFADKTIIGTIGGGRIEKQICEDALTVMKTGVSRMIHYDLLKDLQMCCGGSMDFYIEPVMNQNKLYIFGGGHTGKALAERAAAFDFEVTVIDDRADYLQEILSEGITKLHGTFPEVLHSLPFDVRTYICIMTYSHPLDRKILAFCIKQPHAYLGMIGSRRKVEVTKRLFEEEGIRSAEEMDTIDMPMGLDIGADNPDEISISILAKLIAVKNQVTILP